MISHRVNIWLSLVFSGLAAVLGGIDLSFNVYALILKESFNFTQTEVEVVASMSTIGVSLSILEMFVIQTFGYKVTAWIFTMSLSLCSLIFGLVILYRDMLKFTFIPICIIQLLMSTSNCMAYVTITRACIDMMPEQHTGKVISFYLGLLCCGKIFFGVLVDNFFFSNLSGLFFTLAVLSLLVFGGTFLLLHPFVKTKNKSEDISMDVDGLTEPLMEESDTSVKDMVLSPFFHGVFWTTVILFACGATCLNNVTIIAEAVGVQYPLYYVYVFSVTIALIRPACGVLFDKFRSETCGFAMLQISFISFISSMIIGLFYLDVSTMFLSTILYGVGFAASISIGISICVLSYGRACYSAVYGTFYLASSAVQVLIQILFGYFFDLKGEEQKSLNRKCFGRECFRWSFVIMIVISSLTCIIQVIICVCRYIGKRNLEKQTPKQ